MAPLAPRLQSASSSPSLSVRDFYANKSIFVTGATGYVGKFIIEKLLSSTNASKIYILIRCKNGKSIADRFEDYKNDQLFKFRCDKTKLDRALIPISGDVCDNNLGLSDFDESQLSQNVDVIIHSAATVRFNEPLSQAMKMNVLGTLQILNLARKCSNLKSFVYVSTAFANSHLTQLGNFYDPVSVDVYQLIDQMKSQSPNEFNGTTWTAVIGSHPNTYTFTKNLAEKLITDQSSRFDIPAIIVRPSIVCPPIDPQLDYFSDSLSQGSSLLCLTYGLGLIRTIQGDKNGILPFIPVDRVVNTILIAGLKINLNFENGAKIVRPQIFGAYSEKSFRPTNQEINREVIKCSKQFPSTKMLRPPADAIFISNKSSYVIYKLNFLIFDYIFIMIMYLSSLVSGSKVNVGKILTKTNEALETLKFFLNQKWNINSYQDYNDNKIEKMSNLRLFTQNLSRYEQLLFNCHDQSSDNFSEYTKNGWLGGRKYALKESDKDHHLALKHLARLECVFNGGKIFITFCVCFVFYSLIY